MIPLPLPSPPARVVNGVVINPLADYLLAELKRQEHDTTRRYLECAWALNDLGYWLLTRPAGYSIEDMRRIDRSDIAEECTLVDSFPMKVATTEYGRGFDEFVDVYADPRVVDYLG